MNDTKVIDHVDTIEDYLKLPYTIEIIPDSTDDYSGYVVRVVELPGCMTQIDSFDELGEMLQDAMRLWLESWLATGQAVPLPRSPEEYSGKFVVRLPKSLHQRLVKEAEREEVSLNTLVNVALAEYAGMRHAQE